MKKIMMIAALLMTAFVCGAGAQTEQQKLTKEERKAMQQQMDSVLNAEAVQAIADSAFTLEADYVVFKNGERVFVTSNTNFVSVDKRRATVQIAFNIPSGGLNGMGGVTVDGYMNNYRTSTDKKGSTWVKAYVTGVAMSSQFTIQLLPGSNKARIEVMSNFNSRRITLEGHILPIDKSFVIKGNSI